MVSLSDKLESGTSSDAFCRQLVGLTDDLKGIDRVPETEDMLKLGKTIAQQYDTVCAHLESESNRITVKSFGRMVRVKIEYVGRIDEHFTPIDNRESAVPEVLPSGDVAPVSNLTAASKNTERMLNLFLRMLKKQPEDVQRDVKEEIGRRRK